MSLHKQWIVDDEENSDQHSKREIKSKKYCVTFDLPIDEMYPLLLVARCSLLERSICSIVYYL